MQPVGKARQAARGVRCVASDLTPSLNLIWFGVDRGLVREIMRRADPIRWAPAAALVAFCALALQLQTSLGDYPQDAGPAMDSLIGGHFGRFLDEQPLMGSFALLARAPFAFLASWAGGGERVIYEAGVLACVLALCAVAFLLVSRGDLPPNRLLLIPVLAVLTPASRAAVESGHPEELLAAALCVAALLLSERRPLWAAVALGLALATKQWAVLAVIPVLLATPRQWVRRVALVAAAVAAILTVPLVIGNLEGFLRTSHQAGTSPQTVTRASVWFLVATAHHVPLHLPAGFPQEITSYQLSEGLAGATHPAIVLLAPLLGLLVWRRRGDPLAFLALLLLARCVLDPVDDRVLPRALSPRSPGIRDRLPKADRGDSGDDTLFGNWSLGHVRPSRRSRRACEPHQRHLSLLDRGRLGLPRLIVVLVAPQNAKGPGSRECAAADRQRQRRSWGEKVGDAHALAPMRDLDRAPAQL